jgi:hypothetical protein
MFSGCSVDEDEEGAESLRSNTQELEHAYLRGCWAAAELGGGAGTKKRITTSDHLGSATIRTKSGP